VRTGDYKTRCALVRTGDYKARTAYAETVSERINRWTRDAIFGWIGANVGAPLGFYAEHWRPPEEDPHYPALAERYGANAASEVGMLREHSLREVVYAACGFAYTLDKLEALLDEVQVWVEEEVERPAPDEPEPEYGRGVGHPKLMYASFEFMNLLSWLRTIDERLDRGYANPGDKSRAGLLPSLSQERPLRARVEELVATFREQALERRLANYVLHAEALPAPLSGAKLTPDHKVKISIPDRPGERIGSRHDLTYEEGRDALSVAREADQAVEALVNGLIEGFVEEGRAIAEERERAQQPIETQDVPAAEDIDAPSEPSEHDETSS
jgi:hypothetical protein